MTEMDVLEFLIQKGPGRTEAELARRYTAIGENSRWSIKIAAYLWVEVVLSAGARVVLTIRTGTIGLE